MVFLWSQRENRESAFQKNKPQTLRKVRNPLFPLNVLGMLARLPPKEQVGSKGVILAGEVLWRL